MATLTDQSPSGSFTAYWPEALVVATRSTKLPERLERITRTPSSPCRVSPEITLPSSVLKELVRTGGRTVVGATGFCARRRRVVGAGAAGGARGSEAGAAGAAGGLTSLLGAGPGAGRLSGGGGDEAGSRS